MHVKCFNKDISDILAFLNNLIQVLVITTCYSEALASICDYFLIIDDSQYFNNFFEEVTRLKGANNAIVLPEATGQASNQIFNEQLRLILDAVTVKELSDGCYTLHLECFV